MAARWVALVMAVMMFAVVGFFVVVALNPPTATTRNGSYQKSEASSAAKMIPIQVGPWTVTAEVATRSGRAEITLSMRNDRGEVARPQSGPDALLRMTGMAMAAEPVALEQLSPGVWRGLSVISMPGSWSYEVTVDGQAFSVGFVAPE